MLREYTNARRFIGVAVSLLACWGMSYGQAPDSLYRAVQTASGYYTPRPLTDTLLIQRAREVTDSGVPLVRLLVEDRTLPINYTPSILASKLSLPLVTSYANIGREAHWPSFAGLVDSLGLGRSLLPPGGYRISRADGLDLMQATSKYIQLKHLSLFDYAAEALMAGRKPLTEVLATNISQIKAQQLEVGRAKAFAESLSMQEVERKYWIPSFESSIQFSQNYISENWYKGGSSSLNLYMRTYGALLYAKDNIRWNNEFEDKLSLYSADPTSRSRYRISEDLFRLRSNFGIRASKRWLYTLDAEARTQLFSTFNDRRTVTQSALLSPLTSNIGLGMQYSYSTKSKRVYGRSFAFSMNVAPLSHTMRVTNRQDIDLARHGLSIDKPYYHRLGSTMRMNLQRDFSMDIAWTSRVYFNTSYSNVEAEWENTLTMRIGRYFSTRINVHLRYDDSVKPRDASDWAKFVQVNEVLSFGFNYKL